MSSSQSDPDSAASDRKPLPFEPSSRKKTKDQQSAGVPVKSVSAKDKQDANAVAKANRESRPARPEGMSIPDAVSRRMAQRMAVFCGIPSLLGMSTFFVSYFLVTKGIAALPNVAVVLVSMGFFGLGVLGLSYGVISSSWDEENPGSMLGWSEFTTNFGRLTAAWRSAGKKS